MSDVEEERRVVQRLKEAVNLTRANGDPFLWTGYDRVLNSIGELQHYFERMAEVLEDTAFDAIQLYKELEKTLQNGTEQIQNLNDKIML